MRISWRRRWRPARGSAKHGLLLAVALASALALRCATSGISEPTAPEPCEWLDEWPTRELVHQQKQQVHNFTPGGLATRHREYHDWVDHLEAYCLSMRAYRDEGGSGNAPGAGR